MTTTETSSSSIPKIPSAPFAYLSKDSQFLDLSSLEQELSQGNEQRQQAYDLGNQIKAALLKCRASLEQHLPPAETQRLSDSLQTLVHEALEFSKQQQQQQQSQNGSSTSDQHNNNKSHHHFIRTGNLSNHFAEYLRHQAYEHFIQTGTLLPPPPPPPSGSDNNSSSSSSNKNAEYSDQEYLTGVLSFVNFDLKRYVIGKGTVRDAASVRLARDMVATLLDHLLQFDFRNGPLRRKYDGVKYTLKTCETVLYELSVTGCQEAMEQEQQQPQQAAAVVSVVSQPISTGGEEPPSKRSKSENTSSSPLKNAQASLLEELRLRMVEKDELRETLIKKCRDGQKAAKQAIYALHRDDFERAALLLKQCEDCILQELEPIVQLEPSLRHGSYGNVLEEYAEAKLYQVWLVGKDDNGNGNDNDGNGNDDGEKMQEDIDPTKKKNSNNPAKVVLLPEDFSKIRLEPQEYLGGLCDLTGEIGRFAVKKATIRDKENVKNCLETNMSILYAMESLGKVPGNIGKKIDPLRRTVEKQERMLYELSLVEATGRNTIVAGVEATREE
ncbi:MAG: hypothetical protein SGBAC_009476 [Bacillariaceae sp.]